MSAEILTFPSTAVAREFWAAESKRLGTDWVSIAEVVTAIMYRLTGASS
jgi:hypothetical protein